METYNVIVVCMRADGEPILFCCRVECDATQFAAGEHYEAAKELARAEGCQDPMVGIDNYDELGKSLESLFKSEEAVTISIGDR